jgi:hypothetical protein
VGPRAGLDAMEKRKILPLWGVEYKNILNSEKSIEFGQYEYLRLLDVDWFNSHETIVVAVYDKFTHNSFLHCRQI